MEKVFAFFNSPANIRHVGGPCPLGGDRIREQISRGIWSGLAFHPTLTAFCYQPHSIIRTPRMHYSVSTSSCLRRTSSSPSAIFFCLINSPSISFFFFSTSPTTSLPFFSRSPISTIVLPLFYKDFRSVLSCTTSRYCVN